MWGSARVRRFPATVVLWACLVSAASACTIPVFRYALDRWEADPYRLVVPASWATDRDAVKLLVPLRGNGIANVRVEERDDPAPDRARLLFPRDDTPLWEGRLDAATLESLLESPARRGVLERLLAGDSVVWVVAARRSDAADVDRIAGRLRFVEQVAELPVQDPNDPDSRLGPGPPLRLKFSVVEVSLDDPAERMFLRMLAGPGHGELVQRGSPFAAPVFGRGRVLGVWPLEELDDATLEDTSLFLTGRCSCRLKDGNPGWDLLLRVDWERALAAASPHDGVVSAGLHDAPASGAGDRAVETVTIVADDSRPARARFAPLGAFFGGLGLAALAALAGWRLWRAR